MLFFHRLGPMKPKKCSKSTPNEDLDVVKMAKEIKNTYWRKFCMK